MLLLDYASSCQPLFSSNMLLNCLLDKYRQLSSSIYPYLAWNRLWNYGVARISLPTSHDRRTSWLWSYLAAAASPHPSGLPGPSPLSFSCTIFNQGWSSFGVTFSDPSCPYICSLFFLMFCQFLLMFLSTSLSSRSGDVWTSFQCTVNQQEFVFLLDLPNTW